MMEYVTALEERGKKENNGLPDVPLINAIVLVKEDVKDKAQLRIAKVEDHVKGKDGVVRGVKLRLGNGYLIERPVQLVCNLEIGVASSIEEGDFEPKFSTNNSTARPKRKTKSDAMQRIRQVITEEEHTE